MRFILDAVLPPASVDLLHPLGHEATTPRRLGAANLSDDALTEIATEEQWVIVTENARDFSAVNSCPVLLVRKRWWATVSLAEGLAAALDRWARDNAEPGQWAHWLASEYR